MNHNVTQTLKIEAMSGDMSIQEITRRLESVGIVACSISAKSLRIEEQKTPKKIEVSWEPRDPILPGRPSTL